jgi:hypothetical protein
VNPIYDEMADRRGVDVPEDPIDWFAPSTPATDVDPDQMPPEHQHSHGGDG